MWRHITRYGSSVRELVRGFAGDVTAARSRPERRVARKSRIAIRTWTDELFAVA